MPSEPSFPLRTGVTLTTAAHELVSRLVEADQQSALPVVLEQSHALCAVGQALVDRGHLTRRAG